MYLNYAVCIAISNIHVTRDLRAMSFPYLRVICYVLSNRNANNDHYSIYVAVSYKKAVKDCFLRLSLFINIYYVIQKKHKHYDGNSAYDLFILFLSGVIA